MCDDSVNCASLAHQLPSRGHRQGHTNCKGQASTRTRGLFSAPPASSPKLNEYILINHIVHILIWASTKTMQPKTQFTIFGLISLEPINFFFLDLFSHHGNFPILEFQARQWRLVGRRTGIAWGDHRPPLQSPEGAAQTWWKRYFWAIMTKYFFLNCMKHDPHKILRNSFVADCYWVHPIMLKLFARKEEHNLKTKLSRSKSIVSFENSFFKPSGLQIYITPNVLGERKQMFLPDNMCCTIRVTTFSRNFFQPLVSEI